MRHYPTRSFSDEMMDKIEAAAESEGFTGDIHDWIVEVLTIYAEDGLIDGRYLRGDEGPKE